MQITTEDLSRACTIAAKVARSRGYTLTGPMIPLQEAEEIEDLIVTSAPIQDGTVHVVMEIVYKETGRHLRTLDVHEARETISGCLTCGEYLSYDFDDFGEGEEAEHQCEGILSYDDGDERCNRFDTQYYETSGFTFVGAEGWLCPACASEEYARSLASAKAARARMKHTPAE